MGNVNDISDKPISELGIEQVGQKEVSVVSVADNGNVVEVIYDSESLLSKEQTTQEAKAEQPTVSEPAKTEISGETLKQLKPAVKMEFLTNKELVDSKDPLGNKQKHDDIKERFKELKKIIDCLWKT